jgi:hypothetical protein
MVLDDKLAVLSIIFSQSISQINEQMLYFVETALIKLFVFLLKLLAKLQILVL